MKMTTWIKKEIIDGHAIFWEMKEKFGEVVGSGSEEDFWRGSVEASQFSAGLGGRGKPFKYNRR